MGQAQVPARPRFGHASGEFFQGTVQLVVFIGKLRHQKFQDAVGVFSPDAVHALIQFRQGRTEERSSFSEQFAVIDIPVKKGCLGIGKFFHPGAPDVGPADLHLFQILQELLRLHRSRHAQLEETPAALIFLQQRLVLALIHLLFQVAFVSDRRFRIVQKRFQHGGRADEPGIMDHVHRRKVQKVLLQKHKIHVGRMMLQIQIQKFRRPLLIVQKVSEPQRGQIILLFPEVSHGPPVHVQLILQVNVFGDNAA